MKICVVTVCRLDADVDNIEVYAFQNLFAMSGWYLETTLETAQDVIDGYEYDDKQVERVQQLIMEIERGDYKNEGWRAWSDLCNICNTSVPVDMPTDFSISDEVVTLIEEYNGHGIG